MMRSRHAEVAGELADLALDQAAERQQVGAAVAVLGEVADGELAAVAGAEHAVAELVGERVQRGHAQARLEVGGGQAARRGRSLLERGQLLEQEVVDRAEVDGRRGDAEVVRDERARPRRPAGRCGTA